MRRFDVIIIGAGAAGSTNAFYLAKSGLQVLLIEKYGTNKIIKPCGGGISASVQSLFPFDLNPVVESKINEVEFSWKLQDKVTARLPGLAPFWIINRERFDELIISKAIEEGAKVIRPYEVTNIVKKDDYWQISNSRGKEFFSKILVIANGSNSIWPQKFGLGPSNPHFALSHSIRLNGKSNLKDNVSRFEFGLVDYGFAWAFPLSGGVNIGIGTFIGKKNINFKKITDELLPSLGFENNNISTKTTHLRVWNGHSILHSDGLLIIGDAASLCDPFLAEGLRPSIISAYEAAKSINNYIKGESEDLKNYSESIKRKWGDSMLWGRNIAQVFYRFPKVGYQLGIKRPTASKRIAEILSGQMSYKDIAQRVIKRLIFKRSD